MITEILLFVLGLVLLVKGSDFFIKGSASIAKRFGISEFIIGCTLVALGTSIPELASSVIASLKDQSDLVIGNVIGSNIANIGLIVGVAATIALIKTKREMLQRDGYIMLFSVLLFYVFAFGGFISRIEAGFFILLYITYMLFLLHAQKSKGTYRFREFLDYFLKLRYIKTMKDGVVYGLKLRKNKDESSKILKEIFIIIGGSVSVIIGAKLLVEEAVMFAQILNLPEIVIGILFIAVGTSLPELSVTFVAAKKGYGNIAVGNVIGSNIANIFLILGVSGLIKPLKIISSTMFLQAPFMIFLSILLLIFIRSKWQIRRFEGIIFLGLYLLFIISLFIF